jgi:hypothetical protein
MEEEFERSKVGETFFIRATNGGERGIIIWIMSCCVCKPSSHHAVSAA